MYLRIATAFVASGARWKGLREAIQGALYVTGHSRYRLTGHRPPATGYRLPHAP